MEKNIDEITVVTEIEKSKKEFERFHVEAAPNEELLYTYDL